MERLEMLIFKDENNEYSLSFYGLYDRMITHKELNKLKASLDKIECSIQKYSDKEIKIRNEKVADKVLEDLARPRDKSTVAKKPIKGYIYLIESGGYYKIGRCAHPKSRHRKYITENPNEINLILCESNFDYINSEKILLDQYKHKIHRGEWFKLNEKDIINITNFLKQHGKQENV